MEIEAVEEGFISKLIVEEGSQAIKINTPIAEFSDTEKLSETDDIESNKNVINFSQRIGIERPKVAILSATEEVLDSVPSSKEAEELTKIAIKENLNADVFGPLAFDNSISKKSAAIKGIQNTVAGMADVLLVPSVETGNG